MNNTKISFKNKNILVVGAHPDDNDFGCGATVAKAISEGALVNYLIATNGQRGGGDKNSSWEEMAKIRKGEQRNAAKVLGVADVIFLNYLDGQLVPDIHLKEKIVLYIRKFKPDIVFTMDPSFYYFQDFGFINHSDHRAIGEATIDAVYPLARDWLSFPDQLNFGIKPHKVKELLLHSFTGDNANLYINITDFIDKKIKAIGQHKSQIESVNKLEKSLRKRSAYLTDKSGFKYTEAFVRLVLPD